MDITLFTNGHKSILASSNGQVYTLDSALIFQDPDLFKDRFTYQIKRLFNIQDLSAIDNVVFAITGLINSKNNTILKTYLLNDVSRTRVFDWFNFNEVLKYVFDSSKIFLVNDAFATTIGVLNTLDNIKLPSVILTLNDGIGVGVIDSSNNIISLEWGGDFVKSIGMSVYLAVGHGSLYDLLMNHEVEVNKIFTERLAECIKHISEKYQLENEAIKSVVLLGEKATLIDRPLLSNLLRDYDLHIIDNPGKTENIIVKGCFGYIEYSANQANSIVKLEYFSGEEKIYDFDDFEKCRKHFLSVKPITNQNNYYKIIYSNGTVKTLTIGNINNLEELELYRF